MLGDNKDIKKTEVKGRKERLEIKKKNINEEK